MWLSLYEHWVIVSPVFDSFANALESVQVELALKGGQLGLLEETRHDFANESIGLYEK